MKNNFFRKRSLSQKEFLPIYNDLRINEEKEFITKLINTLRENKNKMKIVKTRNTFSNNNNNNINDYKSQIINPKQVIQKKLKSNINLSNEYSNFCGSFLYPDYEYVPGKRILNELKSIGVERTVNKYFSKKNKKVDFIKNSNTYSIMNNRNISTIKTKYLYSTYSNNNTLVFRKNKKNKKIIKNKFNNNTCVDNNKKVVVLYEYNRQNNKVKNDRPIKSNKYGLFKNRNSFNSRNSISSSTSCNSIKMKNFKNF